MFNYDKKTSNTVYSRVFIKLAVGSNLKQKRKNKILFLTLHYFPK